MQPQSMTPVQETRARLRNRVRELRERIGLRQHELARRAGVHGSDVSRVENQGQLSAPLAFVLLRALNSYLADDQKLTIDDLYELPE